MSYSVVLNICSIFVIVSLLMYHFLSNKIEIHQNNVLIILMGSVAFDALLTTATYISTKLSPSIIYILSVFSLLFLNLSLSLFIVYVAAIINLRLKFSQFAMILGTPTIVLIVLLSVNTFNNIMFSVSSRGSLIAGPYLGVMHLLYLYYFFVSFFLIKSNIKNISRDLLIAMPALSVIVPVGLVIDFIYPQILSLHFTITLCILIAFMSMQNSNEFFSQDSLFMNHSAFNAMFASRIDSGYTTECLALSIHNIDLLVNTIERNRILMAEGVFLRKIQSISKYCTNFKMNEGQYLIIIDGGGKQHAKYVLDNVLETMEGFARAEHSDFPVFSTTCLFSCPSEITSTKMIERLFEKLKKLELKENKKNVTTKELNLKNDAEIFEIEETVRTALSQNRLEVYFQPIYNTKTGKYTSAEALIRMKDRNGKFIPPDVFIPIAEKSSLILDIGDFVLEESCRTFSEENLSEYGFEYIEVNLSIIECLQSNLASKIMGTLQKYDVRPNQINLEITETASDDFNDIVDQNIKIMNKYGIGFSIDDFGTGYSSLTRILALQLQIIKLDKSIVQGPFVSEDKNASLLLESFVNTAMSTGAHIVAEGVETVEMARNIVNLGCDYIQGFYFSRPLPRADFVKVIKENNPPPL